MYTIYTDNDKLWEADAESSFTHEQGQTKRGGPTELNVPHIHMHHNKLRDLAALRLRLIVI